MRVKDNQTKNNSNPNLRVVMNGRIYNTETSKVIGVYQNGLADDNPRHYSETLYKKRNGEYFLHGAGGSMSPYAIIGMYGKDDGNGWRVSTMTFDKAKQWAKRHMEYDAYEKEFGLEV